MKRLLWLAPLGVMMACPVLAQPGGGPGEGRGPRNPERMQQMLERFDQDNDGKLSREEREEAWKSRSEARGNQDADTARGPRAAARDGDRPRGPRGQARDGDRPRGPRAQTPDVDTPSAEKEVVAKPGDRAGRSADRPRDGRGGTRFGRPPRDGQARRDGQADGRGPGRRGPAEARGRRGDDPPRDAQARRGDRGEGRGPGRGGPPEGFGRGDRASGAPNIDVMFARLDRDDDGSLSKEEFAVVQRVLRRLNYPQGPGAGGPRGFGGPARDGDRPAGPRADRDDSDRPPRAEARGEVRGGRRGEGRRGQADRGGRGRGDWGRGEWGRGEWGRSSGRPQPDSDEKLND